MPCKKDIGVVRTIGIDTGKNTLHYDWPGWEGRDRSTRKGLRSRSARLVERSATCLIGIEAGMATHHMSRDLLALGHEVKQVPPTMCQAVSARPQERLRDAHAVAEAVQRPSTRCSCGRDRRSIGPEGASPRTFSPHRGSDRCDQSGPWFSSRVRHCREAGTSLSAATAPQILAQRTDVLSPRMLRIVGGHRRRLEISRRSHREGNG